MTGRFRILLFPMFLLVFGLMLATMSLGCNRACKDSRDPAVCQGYVCNKNSLMCETSCADNSKCDVSRGYTCVKTACVCSSKPLEGKTCKQASDCNKDGKKNFTCIAGKCYAGCNVVCEKSTECDSLKFLTSTLGTNSKKPSELGFKCLNPTSGEEVGGSSGGFGAASLPGQGPKGICMIKTEDNGGGGDDPPADPDAGTGTDDPGLTDDPGTVDSTPTDAGAGDFTPGDLPPTDAGTD